MKFNGKKLPKTREDLDRFVREHGMRPYGKLNYRGRDIFIAETDHEHDNVIEYPWGYFQTAWFCARPDSNEKLDIGSWVEFDAMHNTDLSNEGRREARANTAIREACDWIDKNISVGRMDD